MTPKVLYRVAAALLAIFAALHTLSFAQVDPAWNVGGLVAQVREARFLVMGQSRSYADFYLGHGLSVTVWQLVAAVIAWQLGGLPAPARAQLGLVRWGLVLAMAAITGLSWRYFFAAPLGFSIVITLCLALAAGRGEPAGPPR